MHDMCSTCKHEHATCICQIAPAQIADAGQLQDNEARPICCRSLRYIGTIRVTLDGEYVDPSGRENVDPSVYNYTDKVRD